MAAALAHWPRLRGKARRIRGNALHVLAVARRHWANEATRRDAPGNPTVMSLWVTPRPLTW